LVPGFLPSIATRESGPHFLAASDALQHPKQATVARRQVGEEHEPLAARWPRPPDDPIDGRPLLLQLQRWRSRQLSASWSLCWSPSSCLHLDLDLISMLWCAALRCAALPFITDTVVMRRFIHQSRAPSCMLGPRRHAGPLRPPPPARASVPGAMTTCTRTVR